ncbi:lipopolysaccharide-binding protein-like isoform X2 [Biomphalaria glabrata]|nr:lipopolysaccharide-binding protein-like isoform X2 [Biomphalaria glabrata]XP_055891160.1 lipopolysaccharide-binding protein-like isoform X2 [Biomphalaria glabrata]
MATSLFYLVIAVIISPILSQNPGVKMRVTSTGIDYAEKVAKSALTTTLNTISLPDFNGKDGNLEYWLKNIRLGNVRVPDIDIFLSPAQRGLTMNVRNFGVDVFLDYRARYQLWFIPIDNSGGATVYFKQVELTVTVGIDQFEDTSPKLVSRSCSANIGDFDVNFQGSLAWLLNLFRGLFSGAIRDSIKNTICDKVNEAINIHGADTLRKLPLEADIAEKFVVDYRLLSPVLFTDRYLETQHKGAVYWKADRQSQIPFSPDVIPAWTESSSMLYLWMTDYVPRTLGYAAHTHGYLQYVISPDKLPSQSKSFLNTTCPDSACAGTLIPLLAEKYPNSLVTLTISSSKSPDVNITSNGLGLTLYGTLDLSTTSASAVVTANVVGTSASAVVTANVVISIVGTASVRGDRIVGRISQFRTTIDSLKSQVGDVDITAINRALDEGMNLILIPHMNAIADAGFPLPVLQDLKFQNPRIIYQDKSLIISTNVQYQGIV